MKLAKIVILAIFLFTPGLSRPPSVAIAQQDHGGHGTMQHQAPTETFEHTESVANIRTEFQVMSLEAMNMKDPAGATHHVMVRFMQPDNDKTIVDAVGKVKLIAPDGTEQIETLKNYNGTFAANFKIEQSGKYGVICLFMTAGEKHVVKFWYPHGES